MKTIKTNLQITITAIILLFSIKADASHIMGMDLSYKCLGNNQYEVFLSFYRDCNGSNAPVSPVIDWVGACGSGSINLQQISVTDITPTCNGISGSVCNGGTGVYGVEEYKNSGILSLPANCSDVKISFKYCCRNYTITTLAASFGNKIYVETYIDNSNTCNNSPVFTNVPVPFGCVGQPVIYNHGATDSDGDDLIYSITDCMDKVNHSINYASGFSGANPLVSNSGLTIDSVTGAINFTPSFAQVAIICIMVEEYRNGVKIGSVVRDIQFNVTNCSNNLPELSGIDSTTNYNTSVTAGNQMCFDIFSVDADLGQNTSIAWNAGISNATFLTASAFNMATFCWTPATSDTGLHVFTVNVRDDYCPLVGQNTYTFSIHVNAPIPPCDSVDLQIITTEDESCSSNNGSIVLAASNGIAPYNYQITNWSTGQTYNNSTGTFNNLSNGSYFLWVDDSYGCSPVIDTFVVISNTTTFDLNTEHSNPVCYGECTGTATVRVDSSVSVLSCLWSNTSTSTAISNLCSGTYSVTVTNVQGCTATSSVQISTPNQIDITIVSTSDESCILNDGTAEINSVGGIAPYSVYLDNLTTTVNHNSNSGNFNTLNRGIHQVRVIDANNCLATVPDFSIDGCTALNSSEAIDKINTSELTTGPNPAKERVYVSYKTSENNNTITLLDIYGRIILKEDNLSAQGSSELNTNHLNSGTYFVMLSNKDGKLIKTNKLSIIE
jgi:hypothetical protein